MILATNSKMIYVTLINTISFISHNHTSDNHTYNGHCDPILQTIYTKLQIVCKMVERTWRTFLMVSGWY